MFDNFHIDFIVWQCLAYFDRHFMRFFMIRSRSSQIQLLFCDTVSNVLLVEPDLDAPFFNLCFFVIFCLL